MDEITGICGGSPSIRERLFSGGLDMMVVDRMDQKITTGGLVLV